MYRLIPGVTVVRSSIACLPHGILKEGELAFIDEQTEFAGLLEINLGGKQGQRPQRSSLFRAIAAAAIEIRVPRGSSLRKLPTISQMVYKACG